VCQHAAFASNKEHAPNILVCALSFCCTWHKLSECCIIVLVYSFTRTFNQNA